MRVTHQMLNQTALEGMQTNLRRLAKIQQQAVTSKRLSSPSDDPFATEQALGFRTFIEQINTSRQSISMTSDWLNATDVTLNDLAELILRAENLALRGASDSLGSDERQALATEIEGMIEEAVAIGNTRHGDNHLFSGFKVDTAPFETARDTNGLITGVTYNGDAGDILHEVEPGTSMVINVRGEPLFTNVIDDLIDLRDTLKSSSVTAADVGINLNNIRLEKDRVFDTQAVLGTKMRRIQSVTSRLEVTEVGLRELLSKAEDADMAEVISQLNQQQFVYHTALAVNGQILRTSLLDFLR
jgi:flagellar hook-associated protein 3 FlgL